MMQELVKNLVITVSELGLTTYVYFGFHVLDFISVFVLLLWLGPKLNISRIKSILIVLIVYPVGYAWMLIQFWIESGFTKFGGQHMVSLFIWIPIFGLLAVKILKLEWKTVCYVLAPCIPLVQTVGHLGCVFAGCCCGYPSSVGLYNIVTHTYHFPIQPIESAIAFSIVLVLLWRAKKQNYVPDAKQYPLMLIMYGSTRFICEFFRDNEKILIGWSKLSFHALFMCVVGIIWLIVIRKKDKRGS